MAKKNKTLEGDNGILDKAKEVGYNVLESAKEHMFTVMLWLMA